MSTATATDLGGCHEVAVNARVALGHALATKLVNSSAAAGGVSPLGQSPNPNPRCGILVELFVQLISAYFVHSPSPNPHPHRQVVCPHRGNPTMASPHLDHPRRAAQKTGGGEGEVVVVRGGGREQHN